MPTILTGGPYTVHGTNKSPDLPGIYVWYGRFHVEEADWNAHFAGSDQAAMDRLLRAIRGHSLKFGRQEMQICADANFSSV